MKKLIYMLAGLIVIYLSSYGFSAAGFEDLLSLFRLPDEVMQFINGCRKKIHDLFHLKKEETLEAVRAHS